MADQDDLNDAGVAYPDPGLPRKAEIDDDDEWEDWDPDQDSLSERDRVMSAVAIEMAQGPCRCCGVLITDLVDVDEARPPTNKLEAIEKARAFFRAALWNAQIVRLAIPTRSELAAAIAAARRLLKLLKGEHEAIAKANGCDREFPSEATEEEYQRRRHETWCPPYGFLANRAHFDESADRVAQTGEAFVAAVEGLLQGVDSEIAYHMFDPPTDVGRPRTSFVERYAYRYLTEMGLTPAEIEGAVGELARELRAVEDRIGLKKMGKSANPRSLISTIRRCSTRR